MNDKNYVLIRDDNDVRKLVEIPVEGRINVIGFTRYSVLTRGSIGDGVPEPNGSYPVISSEVFNELYGKVLTLVDATFQEGSQKEAFKSLIKNEMSSWYDKSTSYTLKMTEQAYKFKDAHTEEPESSDSVSSRHQYEPTPLDQETWVLPKEKLLSIVELENAWDHVGHIKSEYVDAYELLLPLGDDHTMRFIVDSEAVKDSGFFEKV